MVRHLLFFKLKDDSPKSCAALRDMFLSMQGNVPQVIHVASHIDFLHAPRSYDVLLDVTLDSPEALDEYQRDPYHCDVVKTYVHSVIESSASIDYIY